MAAQQSAAARDRCRICRASEHPKTQGAEMPSRTVLRYPAVPMIDRYGSIWATASALGVTTRTVLRWAERGLSWAEADRGAIRLGLHPVDVWPSWFDDALANDTGRPLFDQQPIQGVRV